MNKRERTRCIARNAMLSALVIIFSYLPITIGPVRLAILMLIPVLIVGQVEKILDALFIGFVTGLSSLIVAVTNPMPLSIMFINPMVSIFPRILIGVNVFLVSKGLIKLFNKLKIETRVFHRVLVSVFSTFVGVLTNTGFVLLMIWMFYGNKEVNNIFIDPKFMSGLISLNFVIELISLMVIVPAISMPLKRYREKQQAKYIDEDGEI